MHNQSEREELIKKLKSSQNERLEVPINVIVSANPVNFEEYKLLIEHWHYLMRNKQLKEPERTEQLENVRELMLIAQYGDEHIGRFTNY